MELKVKRINPGNANYTIGNFYIDDVKQCNSLEDQDRGLKQTTSLSDINKIKVYGQTAIPTGKYQVAWTYSDHFKKTMPLLMNVPGYAGVRIHSGNTPEDTLGCILLGYNTEKGKITSSRDCIAKVYPIIEDACKKGKVYITIE